MLRMAYMIVEPVMGEVKHLKTWPKMCIFLTSPLALAEIPLEEVHKQET